MIILKVAANFGGELHKAGTRMNLSQKIENRMVENGLAVFTDEKKELSEDEITDLACPICGKVCKNKGGFDKHYASCKKKAESDV